MLHLFSKPSWWSTLYNTIKYNIFKKSYSSQFCLRPLNCYSICHMLLLLFSWTKIKYCGFHSIAELSFFIMSNIYWKNLKKWVTSFIDSPYRQAWQVGQIWSDWPTIREKMSRKKVDFLFYFHKKTVVWIVCI